MHEMRQACTSPYEYSIKAHFTQQLINSKEAARNSVHLYSNAQLLQIFHLTLYNFILWQTEFRNTVGKHSACYMKGFKNSNLVSLPSQIASTGQASWSSTNNCNPLSIMSKFNRLNLFIFCQLIICYKTLKPANCY